LFCCEGERLSKFSVGTSRGIDSRPSTTRNPAHHPIVITLAQRTEPAKRNMETYKRLRIAVLNRVFSPTAGGAERYSIALVEHISAHHEVHVFAQDIQHAWPGVSYHKVPLLLRRPRWINQLMYATLTWWATRRGFDVVHSHENSWHGQVQTIHVLPLRFNLFLNKSAFQRTVRWLQIVTSPRLLVYLWLEIRRYAPSPCKSLVATSATLLEIMQKNYPQTRNQLALIEPGVGQIAGLTELSDKNQARAQLLLPLNGHYLLFVGNDYEKKGLGHLLLALSRLPDHVNLLVVGSGSQIPKFKIQAESLGLLHRVFFLGVLQDVSHAYKAANCLVHPTLEDTYAMVVLEAMAHGLPVVVSSEVYCGISRSLCDGKNALIVQNPRDIQELIEKIKQLLDHPDLGIRLSMAALDFAKAHLWSESAKAQEKVYQTVARLHDGV
jgi:glycosyltransferase involved in cell wall biosynthesis